MTSEQELLGLMRNRGLCLPGAFLLSCLVCCALDTFKAPPVLNGSQSNQDQGRMVDIGGRELYMNCSGQRRSPTVVLEAGSEATSESWRRVQAGVSKFAYVCSYDRAGLGRSPSAGHEESVAENVADLHALLGKSEIAPPYILVGHSSGGLRVRRYQTQFNNEVVGMVLVDSAHEEEVWRFNDAIPGSVRGVPADPANLPRLGMLPPRQRLQWRVDIPLIVLVHGKPMELPPNMRAQAALAEKIMHDMQQDLASRSAKGELRTAEHSGHDIPNEEPEVVVQAIRDVASRVSRIGPRATK